MDRNEYLRKRGLLTKLDMSEEEIIAKAQRVDGDLICPECRKPYYDHPYIENCHSFDGDYYLKIICNGLIVKL